MFYGFLRAVERPIARRLPSGKGEVRRPESRSPRGGIHATPHVEANSLRAARQMSGVAHQLRECHPALSCPHSPVASGFPRRFARRMCLPVCVVCGL